jgi:hypothetical protein
MLMFNSRISSLSVCAACFEGTFAYHLYAQCMHQFLTHMLSANISFGLVCSGYESVPDSYDQCMNQFLISSGILKHLWGLGTK